MLVPLVEDNILIVESSVGLVWFGLVWLGGSLYRACALFEKRFLPCVDAGTDCNRFAPFQFVLFLFSAYCTSMTRVLVYRNGGATL